MHKVNTCPSCRHELEPAAAPPAPAPSGSGGARITSAMLESLLDIRDMTLLTVPSPSRASGPSPATTFSIESALGRRRRDASGSGSELSREDRVLAALQGRASVGGASGMSGRSFMLGRQAFDEGGIAAPASAAARAGPRHSPNPYPAPCAPLCLSLCLCLNIRCCLPSVCLNIRCCRHTSLSLSCLKVSCHLHLEPVAALSPSAHMSCRALPMPTSWHAPSHTRIGASAMCALKT